MSNQMTLPGFGSATSSPESGGGPSDSGEQGGQTTDLYGQDHAPARRSRQQEKEASALAVVQRAVSRILSLQPDGSVSIVATNGAVTIVTCSQSSYVSSVNAGLQASLESRLRAKLAECGSTLYALRWKNWELPSGPPICALRASAHRIYANGSFSGPTILDLPQAGWGTPQAHEGRLGYQRRRGDTKGTQKSMTTEAIDYLDPIRGDPTLAGWNTPRATDGSNGGPNQAGGALPADAHLSGWPTPMAGTPARNGNSPAGNTDSSRKTVALAGWPTLTATDSTGAGHQGRQGGYNLQTAASQIGPARLTASGQMLTGSSAGMESGGPLNPALPRWLMGYPAEWDSCGATAMQSTRKSRKHSSKRPKKRGC